MVRSVVITVLANFDFLLWIYLNPHEDIMLMETMYDMGALEVALYIIGALLLVIVPVCRCLCRTPVAVKCPTCDTLAKECDDRNCKIEALMAQYPMPYVLISKQPGCVSHTYSSTLIRGQVDRQDSDEDSEEYLEPDADDADDPDEEDEEDENYAYGM